MTAPPFLAHAAGDVPVVIMLTMAAVAYAAGDRRVHRARRTAESVAFTAGLVVLGGALAGPLADLAGELFAAHMGQHVVLVAVAPPLIVLGRPGPRLLRLLPIAAAARAGRVARLVGRLRAAAGPGPGMAAAVAAGTAALWIWHLPPLYQAAVRQPAIHAVEHTVLLATAGWFWAEVVRLHRRRAHGYALAGLFAAGAAGAALGVLLAFSGRLAYPVHAAGAARFGLSPLEDQQVGAVAMWMGGGLIYVAAAVTVAARWLAAAGTGRKPGPAGRALAALATVLVAAGTLPGCGRDVLHPPAALPDGNPALGREAIIRYGCGSCHLIPGVPQADSKVAPPLVNWSERAFVGGRLANTPGNLMRWIMNPQDVDPGSPMPNLDVTEADARHIAAYLLTLG